MPLVKVNKTPLLPLLFFSDNTGSAINGPHWLEDNFSEQLVIVHSGPRSFKKTDVKGKDAFIGRQKNK